MDTNINTSASSAVVEHWSNRGGAPVQVYRKMQAVMLEVGHIDKSGYNSHHKYKFTRSEDICKRFQRVMSRHGLLLVPSMSEFHRDDNKSVIKWEMTLVDTESGQEIKQDWWSEAADTQDKGINKAATAAIKYYLLKTFLVPDESEPDADAEADIIKSATARIDAAASADELKQVGAELRGKVPANGRDTVAQAYKTKTQRLKAEIMQQRLKAEIMQQN